MSRKLRVQYPGAMYHVMSRGDRREDIFLDDVDRQDFLKTLAEACQKTDWQIHAYCLMRNHYHLVLETPDANLVAGMAWLQSTHTIRLNHRHKLFGHVFSGRYRAQLVEGSGNGYLRTACDYVHLNPVRAGLLARGERLLAYPWSSFGAYLAAGRHRPAWIRVDRLLAEHGIRRDTAEGRQEFERRVEARRWEEAAPETITALRRDWCLGGRRVSPGEAGADGREVGRASCWRMATRERRSQSGAVGGPRVKTARLDGGGFGGPAQKRPLETGDRGTLAERDHAYAQGHCGAGSTGHLEGSQYQSAQMDASQTTRKPGASPCPIMNEPFYGLTPIES